MHPILFHIGPITVRTYGVLVALAFLASLRLARAAAHVRHLPESFMLDLVAILIVGGLLGARLFYIFQNPGYFLQRPLEMIKIWEGGLVFYGGFLTASAAGIIYTLQKKMPLGKTADCIAPALAVGQAVGRWGCFFAGCCYGKPTGVPWSVQYKDAASLAPLGVMLHPVQLYESFGDLLIALFLWIRLTRGDQKDGDVFWFYVLLYGSLRFGMELLRGDDRGPTLGGLFPSQVIAIVVVILACSVLIAERSAERR